MFFADAHSTDRCLQTTFGEFTNWPDGDCFFGVPSDAQYGREPLQSIPRHTTGFHFYEGGEQRDLFEAYLQSEWPSRTKRLFVGSSCYGRHDHRDYAQLVNALLATDLPVLEQLELGIWQLFSNSHAAYGCLGNLDQLGLRQPLLQRLAVYGYFELSAPWNLSHLQRLQVTVDDSVTGLNGGPLDPSTVCTVLQSRLPQLRELWMDLECDDNDQLCYTLPENLLTSDVFPELQSIEIAGRFGPTERDQLATAPSLAKPHVAVCLEDMLPSGSSGEH